MRYEINKHLVKLKENDVRDVIDTSGAILRDGPYKLFFGECSDNYFDLNNLANNPRLVGILSSELIEWTRKNIKYNIDVVLSSVDGGGRIFAFDIIRAFNGNMETRGAQAPIDLDDNYKVLPELTLPSRIYKGENVLIVNGMVSSNEDLKNLEIVLKNHQANMLGIVSVASQNEESRTLLNEICERNNVPSHVLVNLYWNSYQPNECPHGDNEHTKVIGDLSNFFPIIFGLKNIQTG